jgi:NADPH:quinone reductase-like Zn-dependent oxidoreductase
LREAASHFFTGHLKPVIDEVVPLAEAAAAHVRLETKEHFGKVVLTP